MSRVGGTRLREAETLPATATAGTEGEWRLGSTRDISVFADALSVIYS